MAELAYGFDKVPYTITTRETPKFKETYGGGLDTVAIDGMFYRPDPKAPPSKVALLFMHPSGLTNPLRITNTLPKAGIPVICGASRYPRNDSALIMEKVAKDMGEHVRYAKEQLGFEKVVLAGWSGGGSLSLFYQSEAEDPTITHTPAGDEYDLTSARLIPADGVLQLACHVSRAVILTEWLDAAIRDENDPYDRDPALDLFGRDLQPPYDREFVTRYRAAQVARSQRIDNWVWEQLERIRKNPDGPVERCFVVHGTKADPAVFDSAIDPSDRKVGPMTSHGAAIAVNTSPAGLGRYSSLRSWLSQWSYAHSRAHGARCAERVTVPALVVQHTADDICLPSHGKRIYEGFKRTQDVEFRAIKGATHFYADQTEKLMESVDLVIDYLDRYGMR